MKRTIGFLLAAVLAVTGLTACMSDDNSSARGERRSAALVEAGEQGSEAQMTVDTIVPAGQAIEALQYNWGVQSPLTFSGGGGGGGLPEFRNLTITKTMDESSPKLFEAVARGTLIPQAELKLYTDDARGRKVNYATYTLEPAYITSVQSSGQAQGQSLPLEEVTFTYGKIRWETRVPDASGGQGPPVRFGWDVVRNRPW